MNIKRSKLGLLIEKSYIFIIFLSLVYGSLLANLLNISFFRVSFFLLSFVFIALRFFISSKIKTHKEILFYSLLSIPFLVVSLPFWMSTYSINSYIGLIVAFFVFSFNQNTHYFYKLLKITIYLVLIIAIYEYIIKDYIYVEEVIINDKKWLMDAHLFGGKDKVFRAKAIFPGPLTLAQFATGVAFIFHKNTRILLLMFILCFLANARLGLLIVGGVLFVKYLPKILSLKINKYFFVGLFVIIIAAIVVFSYYIDEQTLNRLLATFDVENKGNSKRIDYWMNGINEWWNYDLTHKALGNNGYFRSIYDNNAENGWITLLLENGILGFLYYALPLGIMAILSIIKKSTHVLLILLIAFSMFVQTYYLGGSTNLLYWFTIFLYYTELKANNHETRI